MRAPSVVADHELPLGELRTAVCATVAALEVATMDRDVAVIALHELSAIANAADAAMAMVSSRLDELGPPAAAGASSAAEFIAKQTGTTTDAAKRRIARGAQIRTRPLTHATAVAGRISPDQADAVTQATAVNPDAEATLLDSIERDPIRTTRTKSAEARAAVVDLAEVEREIHRRRSVRRWTDAFGAEHLHATGPKQFMARVDRALKRYIEPVFQKARRSGQRESYDAYAFDALVAMADDATSTDDPEPRAGARSKRVDPIRHLSILRADLSAVVRGRPVTGETCEIAGLGPVSVTAARELLGESVLKLVITNGVDVVNVTHLGRGPTTAQKVALLWQKPTCMREGCGREARLEYDHPWGKEFATTKHTRIDELEPMCDADHSLRTYFDWALVEGEGVRPLVPPDDPRHPGCKERGP